MVEIRLCVLAVGKLNHQLRYSWWWDGNFQRQLQNNQNSVAWANQLHIKKAQEWVCNLDGLLMLCKTHLTYPEECEPEQLFLCASDGWVEEEIVAYQTLAVHSIVLPCLQNQMLTLYRSMTREVIWNFGVTLPTISRLIIWLPPRPAVKLDSFAALVKQRPNARQKDVQILFHYN